MDPKGRTLIERLGFTDPDRKNSNHDLIQLWVFNNIEKVLGEFLSDTNRVYPVLRQLERPIIQETNSGYKSIIGFVDLFVHGYIEDGSGHRRRFDVSIEIKSSIRSCGDLIRQIEFYRSYERSTSSWLVVSNDDKFKDILLSQGISFFKYNQTQQLSMSFKNP